MFRLFQRLFISHVPSLYRYLPISTTYISIWSFFFFVSGDFNARTFITIYILYSLLYENFFLNSSIILSSSCYYWIDFSFNYFTRLFNDDYYNRYKTTKNLVPTLWKWAWTYKLPNLTFILKIRNGPDSNYIFQKDYYNIFLTRGKIYRS